MDGSDDLFGGLPAVSKNAENTPTTATTVAAAAINTVNDDRIKPAAYDASEKVLKKRNAGASLVSSLGTAGTAMAFVPHAIRKKPNQAFVPHAIRKKKKVSQQPQPQPQQLQHTSKKQNIVIEQPLDVHAALPNSTPNNNEYSDSNKTPANKEAKLSISETTLENTFDETNNQSKEQQSNSEPYLENEPESLRLLHASVTHPYDPHFPNDYLAYRERKKTEQVRKDLQRSALQRLDQQEKLRKKIEEERKKILESGDLDKIVESRGGGGGGQEGGGVVGGATAAVGVEVGVGRGRGRGRGGVSNLPAWLLKQQQEQKGIEANERHPALS